MPHSKNTAVLPSSDAVLLGTDTKSLLAKINELKSQLATSEAEKHKLLSVNKLLRDRLALVCQLQDQLRDTLQAYDEISNRVQEHIRLTAQLQNLVEDGNIGDAGVEQIPSMNIKDLDKMVEGLTAEPHPGIRSAGPGTPVAGRRGRRNTAPLVVPVTESVVSLLKMFPLFAEFPPEVLTRMALSSYEMRRSAGQHIIRKGEIGAEMFFLDEGKVNVMATMSDGQDVPLATLVDKSFFGELGVLFDNPRTANVIAQTDCLLFVVTKQKINEALQNYPNLQANVQSFARDRAKWWDQRDYKEGFGGEFIANIARKDVMKLPIFADASEDFLENLALRVTSEVFPPDSTIIAKDDPSDCIFFIIRGSVQVLSADNTAVHAEMTAGSFFGEVGIILNMKRTANIKAKEECFLLKLTKESLEEVQSLYPAMKQKIQEAVEERYALYKDRTKMVNRDVEQFHMEVGQQQLTKLSIFKGIDNQIVGELALLMEQKSWKPGDCIIKCGDKADSMFFLASGEVSILSDFNEEIDKAKGPDAWFGEVGLLQDLPRTATVKAKTDCSTFELKKMDFMASLKKHPVIAERIEETARERLQAYLMRSVLA